MEERHRELFEPLRVRGVELPSRVVVPPMYQVRPVTSPQGIAWYRRLAAGGAALVIVEGLNVARFGDDLTPAGLAGLAKCIHAAGAAAAVQLFPGSLGADVEPDAPDAEDLRRLVGDFARAAAVCRDAGFDGVEPHGAHGFALNRFFMPDRNHRTDAYGGSLDNRCRLAVEIVRAIRAAAGEDLLVLYRHTPVGQEYSLDESLVLADKLVAAGADVLDISPAKKDRPADLAQPFRTRCAVPVIAVGGMEDPDAAAEALRSRRCDLVGVGRQLIADAAWPAKVRAGRFDEIIPCDKCDAGCFGNIHAGKPVYCTQWPDDPLPPFVR